MSLLAFGLSHKTAPVEVRECFALEPDRAQASLLPLIEANNIAEAVVVNTCNRSEVYCYGSDIKVIENWFCQLAANSKAANLSSYTYVHQEQAAVKHLMRVAASLDSMVIGEPQILGQIKNAFATAAITGTIGKHLSRLFQTTFAVAKQVRTDTKIGSSPVSVAYSAVRLSQQIFANLANATVLLLGAGDTIQLVARHFYQSGVRNFYVANRTLERAQKITAEVGGKAIFFADVPQCLPQADIVVSSTASQLPILGKGAVERALKLRKHKPMFMVDIAVPRDIEPQVAELEDVYLYTIDDIQRVVQINKQTRNDALLQAENIIDLESQKFMAWLKAQPNINYLCNYRKKVNNISAAEIEKALQQLRNGANAEQLLQQLAYSITNKIIHQPTLAFREAGLNNDKQLLETLTKIFDVENR